MTSATNSPRGGATVLQVEARKAYALAVSFLTPDDLPVDLTDCSIDFVMKPEARTYTDVDDADNLITNSAAFLDDPTTGFARFSFQATDFDVEPGTYPFVINLTTAQGYPVVAVKGEVEVLNNPSTGSLDEVYPDSLPVTTLDVILRNQQVMKIRMGNNVPPGYGYLSDVDKAKIDQIGGGGLGSAAYLSADDFAPTAAGVPGGGAAGSILAKFNDGNYQANWVAPASIVPPTSLGAVIIDHGTYTELVFTPIEPLDATGISEGYVPVANGGGSWGWEEQSVGSVIVNADDIEDGITNVMMLATERDKLETLEPQVNADWDATSGPEEILNKPDVSLVGHTHRFLELDGVSRGPIEDVPDPGEDGDVYIVVPGP